VPCSYYVIQINIAFHGGNTGSNPVGDANLFNIAQISWGPDYNSFFYASSQVAHAVSTFFAVNTSSIWRRQLWSRRRS